MVNTIRSVINHFHGTFREAYGKLVARPDLGHVERIESKFLWIGITWLHDLHLGCPFDLVATFDRIPKLLLGVIGVLPTNTDSLRLGELLLTMLGDEVILDIHKFSVLVDPFERVAAVAVLVDPAIYNGLVSRESKMWLHATDLVCRGPKRTSSQHGFPRESWPGGRKSHRNRGGNSSGCVTVTE